MTESWGMALTQGAFSQYEPGMIDSKGKIQSNSSRVHRCRATSAWLVETDVWRSWMLLQSRGTLSLPCVLRPSNGLHVLPEEEGWTSRIGGEWIHVGSWKGSCLCGKLKKGLSEQFLHLLVAFALQEKVWGDRIITWWCKMKMNIRVFLPVLVPVSSRLRLVYSTAFRFILLRTVWMCWVFGVTGECRGSWRQAVSWVSH